MELDPSEAKVFRGAVKTVSRLVMVERLATNPERASLSGSLERVKMREIKQGHKITDPLTQRNGQRTVEA